MVLEQQTHRLLNALMSRPLFVGIWDADIARRRYMHYKYRKISSFDCSQIIQSIYHLQYQQLIKISKRLLSRY